MFCENWEFRNHLEFVKESLGLTTDRPKEPEIPPAERALRTSPVRGKEPPAAREQGPRAQCKGPEG